MWHTDLIWVVNVITPCGALRWLIHCTSWLRLNASVSLHLRPHALLVAAIIEVEGLASAFLQNDASAHKVDILVTGRISCYSCLNCGVLFIALDTQMAWSLYLSRRLE
ncbi:hypothetical protein BDQ17DRAFT_630649 [Cyathus striatus]|nr:hypothetical protein BDQ17DRAFT_630649 [Cyathus striatus]